jgi:hypothetical protein
LITDFGHCCEPTLIKEPETCPVVSLQTINQLRQKGSAYEGGEKVMEFPVLTGDAETPNDPGTYLCG